MTKNHHVLYNEGIRSFDSAIYVYCTDVTLFRGIHITGTRHKLLHVDRYRNLTGVPGSYSHPTVSFQRGVSSKCKVTSQLNNFDLCFEKSKRGLKTFHLEVHPYLLLTYLFYQVSVSTEEKE